MNLSPTYLDIWKVSLPIIIGSAAQNIVAMTDSVFLYYKSEDDFAAMGFVATFYIIIAAIGFGFSRGGQILIARKVGQQKLKSVGHAFISTVYFELILALFFFLFMTFGVYWLFAALVDSDIIFDKSLEYISTRKWGVFASYVGVACIALYTGIARTKFIIIDTFILASVNIFLNWALVFGNLGFPEMGIAGAGLASTIAEYIALVAFVIYMFYDKINRKYNIFTLPKWDPVLIREIVHLAVPIVAMSIVGLGSGFIFFGLVENFGERALAVTNIVRISYLILSIPAWGFCSGVNTMSSYFVGSEQPRYVMLTLWKSVILCTGISSALILPLLMFPKQVLYPILGDARMDLVNEAYPIFWVLWGILLSFSFGSIFLNGMIGAGATKRALLIQTFCSLIYISLIFWVVKSDWGNMQYAWCTEIAYWAIMFILSYSFFRHPRWKTSK